MTALRRRLQRLGQTPHLFRIDERKCAKISRTVCVGRVQPELIERERRRSLRVEPDRAAFSLTELRSVCFGDQWDGQGKRLFALRSPNQIHTGRDVPPLVASPYLNRAS